VGMKVQWLMAARERAGRLNRLAKRFPLHEPALSPVQPFVAYATKVRTAWFMVPIHVHSLEVRAFHEPTGIVGAEVTRRNNWANRVVRLLTSAPTGFMAGEQVRKERGAFQDVHGTSEVGPVAGVAGHRRSGISRTGPSNPESASGQAAASNGTYLMLT